MKNMMRGALAVLLLLGSAHLDNLWLTAAFGFIGGAIIGNMVARLNEFEDQ